MLPASGLYIIQKKDNVWTDLDTAPSATSTEGTWYDMHTIADGADIEVWWGPRGSGMTKVMETDSAEVLTLGAFYLGGYAPSLYSFDDIRIVNGTLSNTTSMSYDDANELTSMTGNGTTTFTYNDWGRLATKTQGGYQATYLYRFGHKLKRVDSNFPGEAALVQFNYDAFGKCRVMMVNEDETTWYRWHTGCQEWGGTLMEYHDPDVDWDIEDLYATYIPGLAEVMESDGSYRYHYHDKLGSVRRIRDDDRDSLAQYEYNPYGDVYSQSGTEALNFGFAGMRWMDDAQMYLTLHRFYSPDMHRWTIRDPLGLADGPNLYAYVKDNPVNYKDPVGQFAITGFCWGLRGSIRQGVQRACDNLGVMIVNSDRVPDLRECLHDRCQAGRLRCTTGPFCLPGAAICLGWIKVLRDSRILSFPNRWVEGTGTISVCVPKFPGGAQDRNIPVERLFGESAIHEWGHTCGWQHGEGCGIPGSRYEHPSEHFGMNLD